MPVHEGVCVVCRGAFAYEHVGRGRRRLFCSSECRRGRQSAQTVEWRLGLSSEERRQVDRRKWLQRKYGLTPEVWEEMFEAQGRVCAACGTDDPGASWHTDHCHSSGAVRGILCPGCNSALGQVGDSVERLLALCRYLAAS